MRQMVAVLALLTAAFLPVANVDAAATLERPSFSCGAGGATLRFSWRPADGAAQQYLDISLQDNGFVPGTYISAGPFEASVMSYSWAGVRPNVRHFYRLNTLGPDGWQSVSETFAAPCRPVEASTGGRETPFDLYPGVYTLDLANGAIRRLQDGRGATPLYGQVSTYAWSPDGTRIASIKGAGSPVSIYDAATGGLLREVRGQAWGVDWLQDGTIAIEGLQPAGPEDAQGLARVDPESGSVLSFDEGAARGVVSPDGGSLAIARSYSYGSAGVSGLYVRTGGTVERLVTSSQVQAPGPLWSPDSTRIAAWVSTERSTALHVFDAATGTDLARHDGFSMDLAWSPDGRWLAATSHPNNEPHVTLYAADGSSTSRVTPGSRPTWSPDSASLIYVREGALWFVSLADGLATPLLRPELPMIEDVRWSPAGDGVAFRVSGAYSGVYVMRPDGSGERYLAPGYGPRWSPKGDRLAFLSGGGQVGFSGSVVTMTPQSTRINRLAGFSTGDVVFPCQAGQPLDWSPNGASIVYLTQNWEGMHSKELFTVDDKPGAQPRRLARGAGPDWSPDGRLIAYTAQSAGAGLPLAPCEVAVSAPDGSSRSVVSLGRQAPQWSPDGRWLLVADSPTIYSTNGIAVVAADGSGQRAHIAGARSPVWSPDSSMIAYIRFTPLGTAPPPPNEPAQLIIAAADGSAPRVVAEGAIWSAEWAPDGKRLVYTSSERGRPQGIYVVDLEAGESKRLADGSAAAWSPDGQWIAFTR